MNPNTPKKYEDTKRSGKSREDKAEVRKERQNVKRILRGDWEEVEEDDFDY